MFERFTKTTAMSDDVEVKSWAWMIEPGVADDDGKVSVRGFLRYIGRDALGAVVVYTDYKFPGLMPREIEVWFQRRTPSLEQFLTKYPEGYEVVNVIDFLSGGDEDEASGGDRVE